MMREPAGAVRAAATWAAAASATWIGLRQRTTGSPVSIRSRARMAGVPSRSSGPSIHVGQMRTSSMPARSASSTATASAPTFARAATLRADSKVELASSGRVGSGVKPTAAQLLVSTTRPIPTAAAARIRCAVPSTVGRQIAKGSRTALALGAPAWSARSQPTIAVSMLAGSIRSPKRSVTPSRPESVARADERRTNATTSAPSTRSARTRCAPRCPEAPVTKTRFMRMRRSKHPPWPRCKRRRARCRLAQRHATLAEARA